MDLLQRTLMALPAEHRAPVAGLFSRLVRELQGVFMADAPERLAMMVGERGYRLAVKLRESGLICEALVHTPAGSGGAAA